MKARCVHGVRWFIDCPWCDSDLRAEAILTRTGTPKQNMFVVTVPFWRNMTEADALEYTKNASALELYYRKVERDITMARRFHLTDRIFR